MGGLFNFGHLQPFGRKIKHAAAMMQAKGMTSFTA